MSSLFYNLGKLAGPKIRKAKWAYLAATAPQAEVIEAEYTVGADMARSVGQQFQDSSDAGATDQVNRIGPLLVARLKNNRRRYVFRCISTPQPQAFCLPGGFVFLSDSVIELCGRNDDAIAFICAHEMAHIVEGHVMERMLGQSLIRAVMRAGHLQAITTGAVGRLGVQFLEQAYSRENELRADTLGVRLAAAAGFHSGAAIDLFLKLEPLAAGSLLGQYFSTHPDCQTRIRNIQKLRSDSASR